MKSVSVIISSILAFIICSESTKGCPNYTGPCDCVNFSRGFKYTCQNFDDIRRVWNALRWNGAYVKSVNISHHNISELPREIFHQLCVYQVRLYLPLHDFPDSIFANQEKCLKELTISTGSMEEFPINALISLEVLNNLEFVDNRITELKDSLRMLPLTYLRLDNNNISRIYSDVFPRSLKVLSIVNNDLKSLNSSLLSLTNLTVLNVSNNRIETLTNELTDLINLQYFRAHNNQIETLDNSLHNLIKIKVLDLSANRIATFSHTFHNLDKLKILDLSYNLLTDLQDSDFHSLIHLKNLSLANNRLNSLGKSLSYPRMLEHVNLRGNVLIKLGECLKQLNKSGVSLKLLNKLDLSKQRYVVNASHKATIGNNTVIWTIYTVL